MQMQAIEQALISFFERVAQKEKSQMEQLKQEQCFIVEEGRWCFTLPDLHAFLQRQDDNFSHLDYKQFLQLIYNSPINRTVKTHGAEVTISENREKVDKSGYALVWPDKG